MRPTTGRLSFKKKGAHSEALLKPCGCVQGLWHAVAGPWHGVLAVFHGATGALLPMVNAWQRVSGIRHSVVSIRHTATGVRMWNMVDVDST